MRILKTMILKYQIALFVPTNVLRQFFHCFLYYYDAPIRISAVILPFSGGILRSFYIDQFFGYVITVSQYLLPHRIKFCKISGIVKLLKFIKFF
jgi:hypothetical protein